MSVTEPGGTVVEVALTPEAPPLPLFGMVSEGLHLVGACAFSDETYRTAVEHLIHRRAPVDRLVSERVTLERTPDALVRLRAPGTLVRVIARPWQLLSPPTTPAPPTTPGTAHHPRHHPYPQHPHVGTANSRRNS